MEGIFLVNIVNIGKLAKPLCRFSSSKLFLCLPTMPWEVLQMGRIGSLRGNQFSTGTYTKESKVLP